jgi:arylsulfatase A-like enzyme
VTIAESLHERGYRTLGVTANSWIADYLGFAQGFDAFAVLDFETAAAENRLAIDTLDRAWDRRLPLFLYVHYVDPHEYLREQPYHDRFAGQPYAAGSYDPYTRGLIDRYDAEIHETDQRIGELLDALRARGLGDDTVIAIVADHGEAFYEHGFQGHGWGLHDEEIRVPLLLHAPGHSARTDVVVSPLDLYATLLGIAGARVPPGTPSRSLFDPDALLARGGVLSENTVGEEPQHPNRIYKSFTRNDRKRLILEFAAARNELVDERRETGSNTLYDLRTDPRELAPLEVPALGDELRAAFYAAYDPARAKAPPPDANTVEIDPEKRRRLFELGYLR